MRLGLKILLFSDGCMLLAAGMLGPIYAIFVEEIGGNILDASGAFAAFMLTSGIILYLLGKWEDRVKHKKKIVVTGYLIRCIGFLGYYFVFNPLSLILIQITLGFGEAFGLPAYDAVYTRYLDRGKEASEWGAWETTNYLVAGIGALAGGLIAAFLGFRNLFLVMFGISVLGLFVSVKLLYIDRKIFGIFKVPE